MSSSLSSVCQVPNHIQRGRRGHREPFSGKINGCSAFSVNAQVTFSFLGVKNHIIHFFKVPPTHTQSTHEFTMSLPGYPPAYIFNKKGLISWHNNKCVFFYHHPWAHYLAPKQQYVNVMEWKGNIYTLISNEWISFYKWYNCFLHWQCTVPEQNYV